MRILRNSNGFILFIPRLMNARRIVEDRHLTILTGAIRSRIVNTSYHLGFGSGECDVDGAVSGMHEFRCAGEVKVMVIEIAVRPDAIKSETLKR